MSKLIVGFLIGVVVTLAAVFWLDGNSPDVRGTPTNESSRPKEGEAPEGSASSKTNVDDVDREVEESEKSESTEPPSGAELSASQTESASTPQSSVSAQRTVQSAQTISPSRDYPPEIADMIENSVNKELQARYEADAREESWATFMEGQLAAYFAQKPELAQFNFSLIDCRTSVCEIHALGYGPDALTLWNTGTADIVNQTWHDFRSMSVNRHNPEPDILGVVLILTRPPPN